MKHPKRNSILLGMLALIIFTAITVNKTEMQLEPMIYPIEGLGYENDDDYDLPERQRVALYLQDSNSLEQLTISTIEGMEHEPTVGNWLTKKDSEARIAKPSFDRQLYIIYRGQTVFSTDELIYDYIRFNTICTGPDKSQKLLFSMVRGGSANGDIQDMLFIYTNPITNVFQHKVIERRYLPSVCDMEGAQANEAEQKQLLRDINAIHEKLRPSIGDTYPDDYVTSKQTLPVRLFSTSQVESILTEFKQYIPIEINDDVIANDDEMEEEYIEYHEPEFIVEDIAENEEWRIVEVLYLQLHASWGVLLAENKNTGQWTSFFTNSEGDSKRHLYFNDEVELINGELIGNYTVYGDQQLAISLDGFTVRKYTMQAE